MKFADLRPIPLCNYNHLVPDIDAPDFLERLEKFRFILIRDKKFK